MVLCVAAEYAARANRLGLIRAFCAPGGPPMRLFRHFAQNFFSRHESARRGCYRLRGAHASAAQCKALRLSDPKKRAQEIRNSSALLPHARFWIKQTQSKKISRVPIGRRHRRRCGGAAG